MFTSTLKMLPTIASEFEDRAVGMATCPYRAVPGRSVWSTLETVRLNTEFRRGAVGAYARRDDVRARADDGGAPADDRDRRRLRHGQGFPGGDFVMGKLAAELGYGVCHRTRSIIESARRGSRRTAVAAGKRCDSNPRRTAWEPAGLHGRLVVAPTADPLRILGCCSGCGRSRGTHQWRKLMRIGAGLPQA